MVKFIKYIVFYLIITGYVFGQTCSALNLSRIEDSVWVYTTYKSFDNFNVPSNGMIIRSSAGLILIDTPWDDSLTVELLDSLKSRFNQEVIFAIVTHAHADRIGGICTLRKKGVKVVSYILTSQKAKEQGFEVPQQVSVIDSTFVIGNENLELFYPGAGHTIDNSVVWLPERKILFGGCLVKSKESSNLGNITEADLKEWPRSVNAIIRKFSTVKVIVPGHGTWGNSNLLLHTIDLLKKE